MKECNICANHNCDLTRGKGKGKGEMRTKHKIPAHVMRLSCKKYIKISRLKTTVFEHLLIKQPGNVLALLKNMDMQFVETKRVPFFTFSCN